ncbi:MAG: hypothetical protein K2X27_25445 [Candidatus Obscuribacterales bacterium]|nr:hypothetical protein [Candidatus Obscuribacterales bacterium]
MSKDFLKRYESGDYGVWNEILSQAGAVVADEELYAEAKSVATAIMGRVKTNANTVRKTLLKAGMSLAPTQSGPLSDAGLSFLTNRFGPLPLSLDVFYKTIGAISLTADDYDYGDNELEAKDNIDMLTLDPLIVEPATIFEWAVDEYDEQFAEDDEENNPFALFICADFLHKADISGGEPHTVYIPASTPENQLDPFVNTDEGAMPFIEYLRHYFKWGGFSGLAVMEVLDDDEIDLNLKMPFEQVNGDWRAAAQRLLETLRAGLIDF